MKVNQSTSNSTQASDASASKKAKSTETQAASLKNSEKSVDSKKSETPVESGAKTNISSKAKEFSKAKEVASNTPDVREQKIAELKKRIEEGKYKVNPEAVAEKILKEHAQTAALE